MEHSSLKERLRGRLERAYIFEVGSGLSAYGNTEYGAVYINGAQHCVGRECMVRFRSRDKNPGNNLTAEFITAVVPLDFRGLEPPEYVLHGTWKEYLFSDETFSSKKVIPTLHEINRHYDPGNMKYAFLLREQGDREKSIGMRISPNRVEEVGTIDDLFSQLPNPQNYARVVLTTSEKAKNKLFAAIRERKLEPVEMDVLRRSN